MIYVAEKMAKICVNHKKISLICVLKNKSQLSTVRSLILFIYATDISFSF